MPLPKRTSPFRLWGKVAMCLVVLDLLLFRVGLLWNLQPNFGVGLGADNWHFLYDAARDFETRDVPPGAVVAVGSSVVIFGMDETFIRKRMQEGGTPAPFLRLATHGSTATDSALLVWNSLTLKPWLVIYGAAARDFPKIGPRDSSVVRTFYDSSVELPALPRVGAEPALEARVKRYWKLYRYRFFARTALQTAATSLVGTLQLARLSLAADAPVANVASPEAQRYFPLFRVTPQSYAAWLKWRQTGQFSDYLAWLGFAPPSVLNLYKTQTLVNFGPDGNPQVESLQWMLTALQQSQTRTVLVYLPENPVFRDPEARAYFDPGLSDAYANLFAREAAARGARFEDLRNLAASEDFYDLIHLNLVGEGKLSERIAAIIAEEWRQHTAPGVR